MLGYIRPCKGQLKVCEFEQFQSVYCGLCYSLGKQFGPLKRFLVHYDFTFLALLLSGQERKVSYKRCPVHPLKKRPVAIGNMNSTVNAAVVMTYWKFSDGAADSGLLKRLIYKIGMCWLDAPYVRASDNMKRTAATAGQCVAELRKLEAEGCSSIDRCADTFARMLSAISEAADCAADFRIMRSLLYHIGRWIYIIDACDDYEDDIKYGRYNAVLSCYGRMNADVIDRLKTTLDFSIESARKAFDLWPRGVYTPIIENIIHQGLQMMQESILGRMGWPSEGSI